MGLTGTERSGGKFCSSSFGFVVMKKMAFFRGYSLSKTKKKMKQRKGKMFPKMCLLLGFLVVLPVESHRTLHSERPRAWFRALLSLSRNS